MSAGISLWEALGKVPDPRSRLGRRHPLRAILTLTAVAILSGARSLNAIAQFGRDRGASFALVLGFTRDATPCCATLHYLFKRLDIKAFDRAINRWLGGRIKQGWRAVSVDGKTLRGTQGHEVAGVHVLAAYCHEAGAVLAQIQVKSSTNEHKTALRMLDLIPVEGKVVTGDAAFCQRDLSQKVLEKGGDWVWPVKDNQPELKASIELAFEEKALSPSGKKTRRARAADGRDDRQGARSQGAKKACKHNRA